MSSSYISAKLRRHTRRRANARCEYCLLHDEDAYFAHEPDHVIAEKHGGQTDLENLAWACFDCNRFKGSDIASKDPESGDLIPLFNPRIDRWDFHFEIQDGLILPTTAIGRVTERLLKLNLPERVEVRKILAMSGRLDIRSPPP